MLDPNRNVDPRYTTYVAATKDGTNVQRHPGQRRRQQHHAAPQEGKEQSLRSDIERSRHRQIADARGLGERLSQQEMADVLAYLRGQGPQAARRQLAAAGLGAAQGNLPLLATDCEVFGNEIAFEAQFRNLGFWHGAHDRAVWTVELPQAGKFDVFLDGACDDGSAGSAFVLEGGRAALRGKIAGTGGWNSIGRKSRHRSNCQPANCV